MHRWGAGRPEPGVQAAFRFGVVSDALGVLPPRRQVPPSQALRADGPVVDQPLVWTSEDFDVVVDRAEEANVGLAGGGEDQVLRLAPRPLGWAPQLEGGVAVDRIGLHQSGAGLGQRGIHQRHDAALRLHVGYGGR